MQMQAAQSEIESCYLHDFFRFRILKIVKLLTIRHRGCTEQKKLDDSIDMSKAGSKILIAYEDSESFSALSKFEVFPGSMHRISDNEATDSVSFSQFWMEQSWGNAVKTATGAEIIVVSLSGHMELPVPVKRWMETWPNYEQEERVTLVVVLGADEKDESKRDVLVSYFQRIAEDHGLDFLCHCNGVKNLAIKLQASEEANHIVISHMERHQDFKWLAVNA
jgi:hypothetical protein